VRLPFPNVALIDFYADTNWMVDSGTLRIEHSDALGAGNRIFVSVNSGGTLELGSTQLSAPLTLNTGATLRGTGFGSGGGTATVASGAAVTLATGTSGSDTLDVALSGGSVSSMITASGSGKVRLGPSSNYSGNWTLASGTLEIAADNRLGNVANAVTFNGGRRRTRRFFRRSVRSGSPWG
jgi:hypothetical protein